MNTRHCLKIAARMNTLLVREIGQGIDAPRMLAEPLYARDVLLVCDAMRDSELARLSPRFRRAASADDAASGARSSGFSASKFLGSIFGPVSSLDPPQAPPPARRWFGRSRNAHK